MGPGTGKDGGALIARLKYRLFGWRVNLMFAAQTPGHWLYVLLSPLRFVWLAARLVWGLRRGIGLALPEDDFIDDFTS